ncbi:hypothetical protein N658DRAFT_188948 [Parathielavia hyrcaniae]|uniref:Uncharacterized protein n=1 Tax=Parathielavia hyrcaniae TaxID=113614 RepID=A0AAN6Q8B2_9PEZI|nr:hypothetical protein N658DRAFT_188948 [Parathielavia hyrcaniae]
MGARVLPRGTPSARRPAQCSAQRGQHPRRSSPLPQPGKLFSLRRTQRCQYLPRRIGYTECCVVLQAGGGIVSMAESSHTSCFAGAISFTATGEFTIPVKSTEKESLRPALYPRTGNFFFRQFDVRIGHVFGGRRTVSKIDGRSETLYRSGSPPLWGCARRSSCSDLFSRMRRATSEWVF